MKPSTLRLTTLVLSLAASGFASAETYIVDRYQDDSAKGSLRWAIEQSNANATQENEIQIQAVGKAPYVIKLNQALPPIKSSVKIIGTQWDKTGEFIAIDGSNYIKGEGAKACPGANPEQYGTNVRTTTLPGLVLQDVNGVTLKGLDIHRFCIGVLVNRSSNNLIQHNRISNNYGGSGVMLT
ncbi:MAG: 3-dehydroshikimate dehydratase, partial [Acinetobacter sp.]